MTHSAEYLAYLDSARWALFRARILKERDYRCQGCQKKAKILQVHHLHYRSLGNEAPADIRVLCLKCHAKADKKRKRLAAKSLLSMLRHGK